MEKKEQQTKTLSELYILCVEDTIHDIKQYMEE
jgi:hypothetical protein